jgi:DNA-directed RNA polymerase I, II, and III subunit RPABC1
MESSTIVSQVYKARNTLLGQLAEQGYNVENLVGFSITEVGTMMKNEQLDFMVTHPDNRKVFVKFYYTKALRPANVYDFVEQLFKVEEKLNKNDTLYIVANSDPNETLVRILGLLWQQERYYVNVTSLMRLQYNALEHTLVPKHIVLNDKEAEDIKKQYSIRSNSQLPAISRFDPIAIIIGLRPGQICKIIRPNRVSINSVSYRVCEDN